MSRTSRVSGVLAGTLAGTLGVAVVTAAPAYADGGHEALHHVVYAEAYATSPVVERASVVVGTSPWQRLDAVNQALAYAHDCTGCRAVAIAFQAVLVPRPTTSATPQNVAYAVNLRCAGCVAFAFADQYVVNTGGVLHLNDQAERRIEGIDREADLIAESGADPATMDAALVLLQARFHEVVLAGLTREAHGDDDSESDVRR